MKTLEDKQEPHGIKEEKLRQMDAKKYTQKRTRVVHQSFIVALKLFSARY